MHAFRLRRAAVALALLPAVALVPDAGAAAASVSIADVALDGETVVVSGAASLPGEPAFVVDAGDSSFVRLGAPAELDGMAQGGTPPYTFAWSFAGDPSRFDDPASTSPAFDTAGLAAGPVVVDLTVTDGTGATGTDTVRLALYETTTQRVLDASVDVVGGVPEEVLDTSLGGTVDQQSATHPFTVPAGAERLELALAWETHAEDPSGESLVAVNDFDLYVDDPSGAEDDNTAGATAAMPESIVIDAPAPGDWAAAVHAFLTGPDTYTLTADVVAVPPSPVPDVATAGPFRFETGQPQLLTATVTGGAEPTLAWDLDLDGAYETPGAEVATSFPAGEHLVAVRATDTAGYEVREVTAVRVVEPGSAGGTTPLVVIGVSDTGINPYHQDFAASTFPDPRVLELTDGFTRYPGEYLPGYPAGVPSLPITLDAGYFPAQDHALFTRANLPIGELVWIPGTKIVGALDGDDSQPVNGAPDLIPILDEDGHGTASASVAAGNLFGFCPSCLLVFGEGFASDAFMYEQSWIDLASNSFGSLGNVGFAGAVAPSQPRESAEAGQIALYAAGNGNENAFVTPEQTYTSENLGPDWVVRVGAVDRSSRKPIVGTGKPVDVASFGNGTIPSAAHDSATGIHNHSGTSAATPYTAGVMGTVLGAVRSRLEDTATGPRGSAVLAEGIPVGGSPALADGALTRGELTEAVFKTAEHDQGSLVTLFPPTTPAQFPAQFLVEGYGIVEPASGARAVDVLLGDAPMPERPDEDEFFAYDEALRDALWGDWSGGTGPAPDAPAEAASIVTLDDALAWMAANVGAVAADAGLYADILEPVDGAIVDPTEQATLEVFGAYGFPTGARTRYFPRLDDCGTETPEIADNYRLTAVDGPDAGNGCGFVPGASVIGKVVELRQDYPLVGGELPVTITDGTVEGVVYMEAEGPSLATMRMELSSVIGATPTVLGSEEVDGVLSGVPDEVTAFPFSFELTGPLTVDDLTFSVVWQEAQGGAFIVLDGEGTTSYVDVPVAATGAVELALDDPTFAAPLGIVDCGGCFTASLDTTALADGAHTLYARAVSGGTTSAVDTATFTVARSAPLPDGPVVQVQVVPAGAAPVGSGWVDATGDLASWTATIDLAGRPDGAYEVHARLVDGGEVVATDGPVAVTKGS